MSFCLKFYPEDHIFQYCDLFIVENMTTADVHSYKEIDNKMNDGNKNRTVAATQMNATSRYTKQNKVLISKLIEHFLSFS